MECFQAALKIKRINNQGMKTNIHVRFLISDIGEKIIVIEKVSFFNNITGFTKPIILRRIKVGIWVILEETVLKWSTFKLIHAEGLKIFKTFGAR